MSEDWVDPFEEHFRRTPLPNAAVRVVVMARSTTAQAEEVAQSLLDLLTQRDRKAESVIASARGLGENQALDGAIADSECPLVLITSSEERWTAEHLDPLLKAIDHCDMVIGRRKRSIPGRVVRWFSRMPWKFLFAVPVLDVHSPCRLHRLEKLEPIAFQSTSEFLDVEILAKATFLGHLIDEVEDGDDVVVLRQGNLVARGSVRDVVRSTGKASIRAAFSELSGIGQPNATEAS